MYDEIDQEIIDEDLKDFSLSAYETAMAFGIGADSFEQLAHKVYEYTKSLYGD